MSKGRADVFTDLLLDPPGATPTTSSGEASDADAGDADRGRDPLRATPAHEVGVQVVVSLATLLGLCEDPGEMPGVGPIPAPFDKLRDRARDLAADGARRLLVTDTAGTVVNVSARTYRPTASVARHVRARDPVCRMPGCRRSSQRSDLDHTITYPRGPSTPANLGPLCRRDHNQKTHGLWELANHHDDAGWDWTSPTGTPRLLSLAKYGEPEPPLGD